MLDVATFLASMKIFWLRRIIGEYSNSKLVMDSYPELGIEKQNGGEYPDMMQQIKNAFWEDVLKHFKKLCTNCTPPSVDEFMSEDIHYNINITRYTLQY